jgi:hypothetical protein
MSKPPRIKSAFTPMRPTNPVATPSPPQAEITIEVEIFARVINEPEKACPAWAYIGSPREPDFGCRVSVVWNSAQWPAAAALERKDLRALRWLAAIALLERLSLTYHPGLQALRRKLVTDAFGRQAQTWEAVLWASYLLKDSPLFSGIESLLTAKKEFVRLAMIPVAIDSGQLTRYTQRTAREHKKKKSAPPA